MIDVFAITMALMAGTAGLPHVIIRFYTVKDVRAARWSAFWALAFISMLYTTAPAVAVFARVTNPVAWKNDLHRIDQPHGCESGTAHPPAIPKSDIRGKSTLKTRSAVPTTMMSM